MSTIGREIFKEISIGGSTKEHLMQRLLEAGIQFNDYARQLFEHPAFVPDEKAEKVALVKVDLAGLGLSNPCSFHSISDRASALGLKLCPLYLGAFLRLDYLEQPEGPHLTIASARLDRDDSNPSGFYIRNHEGSLWLRGFRAEGECDWPEGNEFVFVR